MRVKETTPRYIIIKLLKSGDESSRLSKTCHVPGEKVRMRADFSLGMMRARREDSNVFKELEGRITINLEFYAQQIYLSKARVNHLFPAPWQGYCGWAVG